MLGDLYLTTGAVAEAKAALMKAVARDPENWRAHEGLSRALLAAGDPAAAREARLQAVAALEIAIPNEIAPRVDLAQVLARNGDIEPAVTLLSDYAEANPEDPTGWLMLGRMLILAGENAEAVTVLSRSRDLADDPIFALLDRATAHERLNDLEAARADLLSAAEVSPEMPLIHMRLGDAAVASDAADMAVEHFETALELGEAGSLESSIRLRLAAAYLLSDQAGMVGPTLSTFGSDPGLAEVRVLRASADLATDGLEAARGALAGAGSPEAFLHVAANLTAGRQVEDALAILDDAHAAFPDAVEPRAERARLLAALRRYDVAVAEYRAALELAPGRIDLLRGARAAANRMADYDAAREFAETLVAAQPAGTDDLLWLGSIAEAQGDVDAAVEAYQRLIEADASNWIALNNLASVLIARDAAAAVDMAKRAVAAAGEQVPPQITLGRSLLAAGDAAGAAEVLRVLAEQKDTSARTVYRYGVALIANGASEDGRAQIARALAMDEAFPEISDARALLGLE